MQAQGNCAEGFVFLCWLSDLFSTAGQAVLPEIQATLARPSREQSTAPTMMKASFIIGRSVVWAGSCGRQLPPGSHERAYLGAEFAPVLTRARCLPPLVACRASGYLTSSLSSPIMALQSAAMRPLVQPSAQVGGASGRQAGVGTLRWRGACLRVRMDGWCAASKSRALACAT